MMQQRVIRYVEVLLCVANFYDWLHVFIGLKGKVVFYGKHKIKCGRSSEWRFIDVSLLTFVIVLADSASMERWFKGRRCTAGWEWRTECEFVEILSVFLTSVPFPGGAILTSVHRWRKPSPNNLHLIPFQSGCSSTQWAYSRERLQIRPETKWVCFRFFHLLIQFNQSFSVGLQKVYFCLHNWIRLLANCTDNQFCLREGSQSGYLRFLRIAHLDDVFGLHEGWVDRNFPFDKNSQDFSCYSRLTQSKTSPVRRCSCSPARNFPIKSKKKSSLFNKLSDVNVNLVYIFLMLLEKKYR
jgi:hypothetical protein